MISRLRLPQLLIVFLLAFTSPKAFAQCFQIESILVDACDTGADEGFNEMVRFKVGNTPISTSNLTVDWPSNNWQGLEQNGVTAAKVLLFNAQVDAAGGCVNANLLEPIGGVLPANAKVILITSMNVGVTANVFGAITENIYLIFQKNATTTSGHFANYNATPGIRTLEISFGTCTDAVSYERSLLINTQGNSGGSAALQNGATVNFTSAGAATYVNNGCTAPVDIFTVNAGNSPIAACPGATVALSGTAVGYTTIGWTALGGNFSAAGSLSTNYTLPANALGSIAVTLTATNTCGSIITSTVTINIAPSVTPTFTAVPTICQGATLAALPTTSTNNITGTWSPALNNNATTTYTFTPNAGQCAATATLTIAVNQPVTPTFNMVPAICTGSPLAALPTTSLNGIVGIWSPALNNTTTTTYTFVPAPNQCSATATLTISVNQGNTVPTFNAINAICSGSTNVALPTTSTNGITGVWSPAFNNTATTTYTFTPNAGQCALTATLTIVVNPVVTPTFSAVASICTGDVLSALPATSTNAITGTWSPALNNTMTTIYTFTPATGQCATTASVTIVVNSANTVPTFNAVNPVCSGSNIAALPPTSTNGITGSWSPAINNTTTTIYTFTPNSGQCAITTILTIVVTPSITPTFNQVAGICTGDALAALPTTSINNISGVWSPALNNAATTTYTFTPFAGGCATTATLTITVNQPNTVPGFAPVASVCIGSNITPLPTTSINGITGNWSPALNNTATTTYTFTPDPGQCATIATAQIIVEEMEITANGSCLNNNFVLRSHVEDDLFELSDYDFEWKNSSNVTVGTNDVSFNVTTYLNSTPEIEQLPLTFSLTVTSANGCVKTESFVVEGVYCDIQKGISPNGDNKNDFFDLALMGVRQLSIFNRYGTKVYSKGNYTNQWHGQSDTSDELPDGTYYYVIEFNSNVNPKTGWIYINKQAN